MEAGAAAVGFAEAGEISSDVQKEFESWISQGCHGEMAYLQRHVDLRKHTDSVLSGAKTVISLAFPYPVATQASDKPYIASYAFGEDYHLSIRDALNPILENFKKEFGGNWRLCIDSAPVAERYWAVKSGIGFRGVNGYVIIPGIGPNVFLAEILTTLPISPDDTSFDKEISCGICKRCLVACPAGALLGDGTMDAHRCINYLTIEKKSDFTEWEKEVLRGGPGYLFGCDLCLKACPHSPSPNVVESNVSGLTKEDIKGMSEIEFKQSFPRSPMLYSGYLRLLRNATL